MMQTHGFKGLDVYTWDIYTLNIKVDIMLRVIYINYICLELKLVKQSLEAD